MIESGITVSKIRLMWHLFLPCRYFLLLSLFLFAFPRSVAPYQTDIGLGLKSSIDPWNALTHDRSFLFLLTSCLDYTDLVWCFTNLLFLIQPFVHVFVLFLWWVIPCDLCLLIVLVSLLPSLLRVHCLWSFLTVLEQSELIFLIASKTLLIPILLAMCVLIWHHRHLFNFYSLILLALVIRCWCCTCVGSVFVLAFGFYATKRTSSHVYMFI